MVWGDHGFYPNVGGELETTGDFYIGESTTYNIDSTLCAAGVYMNGIVNCRGTGRYLHLVRHFPSDTYCYQYIGGDLIVTPEKEIGQYCTSCSYGDATIIADPSDEYAFADPMSILGNAPWPNYYQAVEL